NRGICAETSFFVPEVAYAEAEEHLAALVIKRGGDPEKGLALLRSLGQPDGTDRKRGVRRVRSGSSRAVGPTGSRGLAHAGRGTRPCPIWTEDTDFFGCGVATWTSDRVRMFLRE